VISSCIIGDSFFSCNTVAKFSEGDVLLARCPVALTTLSFLSNIKEKNEIQSKVYHLIVLFHFMLEINEKALIIADKGYNCR
jgi:hypothetical protein